MIKLKVCKFKKEHTKWKLSLFTQPHVVRNPYDFLFSKLHERGAFKDYNLFRAIAMNKT